MKKSLGIFVTQMPLLQFLEVLASNKVVEVVVAQQYIDLGIPLNLCVSVIQFVFGKSFSNRTYSSRDWKKELSERNKVGLLSFPSA